MSSNVYDEIQHMTSNRVPFAIAGVIAPFVISSIAVLGRFYSRAVLLKIWGIDDTLLLISWLAGGVVLVTLDLLLVQSGAQTPIGLQGVTQRADALKLGFVCKGLYTFTLMTVKLSICVLYARIFQDRRGRLFVYSVAGFVVLSSISIMVAHTLRCDPPSGAWSETTAKCHPEPPIIISYAAFNILGDLALLAFVLPRISKLQIARRQKIALMSVVSLSLLIIVSCVVRTVRVVDEIKTAAVGELPYKTFDITTWTSLEVNTALFCAAAPVLKPLIHKIRPGILSSASHPSIASRCLYGTRTRGNMATAERLPDDDALELGSRVGLRREASLERVRDKKSDEETATVCQIEDRERDAGWQTHADR